MSRQGAAAGDSGYGFLAARWNGRVPLSRLFFMDMLLVGSILNLASTFASLMVLGFKLPLWLSLAVYALPIPFNIFLTAAVWRSAAMLAPRSAGAYKAGALLWLLLATLL